MPFQSSPYMEDVKRDLRHGMTVGDCVKKYPISERTVWRYWRQVQDEKTDKPRMFKTFPANTPIKIILEIPPQEFRLLLRGIIDRQTIKW